MTSLLPLPDALTRSSSALLKSARAIAHAMPCSAAPKAAEKAQPLSLEVREVSLAPCANRIPILWYCCPCYHFGNMQMCWTILPAAELQSRLEQCQGCLPLSGLHKQSTAIKETLYSTRWRLFDHRLLRSWICDIFVTYLWHWRVDQECHCFLIWTLPKSWSGLDMDLTWHGRTWITWTMEMIGILDLTGQSAMDLATICRIQGSWKVDQGPHGTFSQALMAALSATASARRCLRCSKAKNHVEWRVEIITARNFEVVRPTLRCCKII